MGAQETVQDYYARVLKTNKDLKTTACCSTESLPRHVRAIAAQIHPEVQAKFYGCGAPIPARIEGCHVLDLGCGSGRDSFILAKLVGPKGKVVGIDMTPQQLAVAEQHMAYHCDVLEIAASTLSFRLGYIEDLKTAGIADSSMDLVISNCVFNLSPRKDELYAEIFRVLKPGGELYFSDVFVDRRLPESCQNDPVLLGECLGGAQYIEDFRRTMQAVGCSDSRTVAKTEIQITDASIQAKVGGARFYSYTIRAFKLALEDRCEDYGQVAYYKGTIPESPHFFALDDHHLFEANRPFPVCSNSAAMLQQTRFGEHFRIEGCTDVHYGLFDCAPTSQSVSAAGSGCC